MHFAFCPSAFSLTHIGGPETEQYAGVYVGDFLSRAMVRLQPGDLWITIMNTPTVIAIACHTQAAAIILAEGVALRPEAAQAADEYGVAVYSSGKTAYELCQALAQITEKSQNMP